MNTLALILIAVAIVSAVAWAAAGYVRLIRADGYGRRPVPPTHNDQSILLR